ncbi:MAG: dihydrofolate reductase family protein [Roseiflexaceae bacterium]
MGNVLLDITMSLDGYIALPDDQVGTIHDWFFTGDTTSRYNEQFKTSGRSTEVLDEEFTTTGALVVGKRTYDLTNGWEGNHPVHGVPVFVVTHDVPEKVPQGATPFTFVTDGIESAIKQAQSAAGDKIVVVMGGASLAQQCLKAGLLDEIQIHLASVLLGEGVRLFEHLVAEQIELETTRVVEAPGVTHLRFRIVR